jgi:hypothetical protein
MHVVLKIEIPSVWSGRRRRKRGSDSGVIQSVDGTKK